MVFLLNPNQIENPKKKPDDLFLTDTAETTVNTPQTLRIPYKTPRKIITGETSCRKSIYQDKTAVNQKKLMIFS